LVAAAILSVASLQEAMGQAAAGSAFKIRNIRKDQVQAPSYGTSASSALNGGRPGTIGNQWLRIEVQFDTGDLEWADEVTLKYFVVMGKGKLTKMFTGEITHVNVAKGSQHFSAIYIHPNTLLRFGSGQVEAIAIQMFYQNRLVAIYLEPKTQQRWWEAIAPTPGFLLNPLQTPWSVVAYERYEAIKSTP
jgi:hypothetical protein